MGPCTIIYAQQEGHGRKTGMSPKFERFFTGLHGHFLPENGLAVNHGPER